MIKTKETINNENNVVKYSKEEILEKIKEYLTENSEYLDKSYFMGKRIGEINTLLEIYGPEKIEQILKKLELDWFFKKYPKRKFLKEYYLKNYSKKPFNYDEYNFMIKKVNKQYMDTGESFNIEKSFKMTYISWLFKEYPENIELESSKTGDEEKISEEIVDILRNLGIYNLLNDINWKRFKEEIYICEHDGITKTELLFIIEKALTGRLNQ